MCGLGRSPCFDVTGGLLLCDWMSRTRLVFCDWLNPHAPINYECQVVDDVDPEVARGVTFEFRPLVLQATKQKYKTVN